MNRNTMKMNVLPLGAAAATIVAGAATAQPTVDGAAELRARYGAPGSVYREQVVSDLRERIERGEISPFTVLLTEALPKYDIVEFGGPDAQGGFGNKVQTVGGSRGGPFTTFDDDFSSYPRSTDPIFDRFQVNMQGLINPILGEWDFSQPWYIPSLFVDGQIDADDPMKTDPLPRWQGATLTEDAELGILAADLNGDGAVDTADLGQLISNFGMTGAPGFNPADINGDGAVDTADLGLLISEFGQTAGEYCLYTVTLARTVDPDGDSIDPTTSLNGPMPGQGIVIPNGAYSNDADTDGCPDCDSFRILTDGAVNGELVYGDWTLSDPMQAGPAPSHFRAIVDAENCSGWGNEAVMAVAREDHGTIEEACCFNGARTRTPLFNPSAGTALIMECDFYLTSIDTLLWFDTTSSVEGFTVTRTFMGGYAPALTADFLKYSTGGDGYINHFVFLGQLPGFNLGQFYGTVPDPLVGNQGIEIKTNEWFTLSFRLRYNEVSIWLKDSETLALVDPMPGDDGSGTVFDGSDDIEDGFAKIFPTGPFGPAPGVDDGQVPDIPQPPLAAVSMDTFRFLWSGDPSQAQVPGWAPSNMFMDNLRVEGFLFPTPDLPKFALNYLDDIETYFAGSNLELAGGRWFDADSSGAIIDDFTSASGDQSIYQDNPFSDDFYRNEFETPLPIAAAQGTTWTAGVKIAMANTTVARGIRLRDDSFASDPFNNSVALLLTGVENENGLIEVEGDGSSRVHLRVANPHFDPSIEPYTQVSIDDEPPATPLNTPFINVPTNVRNEASELNSFIHYEFEVNASGDLIVRKEGSLVLPDGANAIAAGYHNGSGGLYKNGWDAGSTMITRMSFESGNQAGGAFVALNVDDVTLDGIEPIIAQGPALALPYSDGFEDYPAGAPISGQGETGLIDDSGLLDSNLCIEQGAQALSRTDSASGDWCEYTIKSDAIGGIGSPNDWGLADGDSIFVQQADCDGPVACKQLLCFTNANRPDEFIPNAGLFDPLEALAPEGVRLEFVTLHSGVDPLLDTLTTNPDATFAWDTYTPGNLFGRYEVLSFDDAEPNTEGDQKVAFAGSAMNQPYYDSIGAKLTIGDTIAVDQFYETDAETGFTPSPGVLGSDGQFKIIDPCGEVILSGEWAYLGDGADNDTAIPLDCADVPHFNFAYPPQARYTGEIDGRVGVIGDPTGSGRGNVLRSINNRGLELAGGYAEALRSHDLISYATAGDPAVFEVDCYVTDNNSRQALVLGGPNGEITRIQMGGPDLDPENSPGEVAVPATNFALLENNPSVGGPFGMGPEHWYWDTGVAVPLNAWFRLRATVQDDGSYTIAMDQSGVPGGDGVFETMIQTATEGSAESGQPIDDGANAIGGLAIDTGFDFGGDGAFHRGPIEVTQDETTLPGAFNFPDDFCFYLIDDVDGIVLGQPPAPCNGVFEIGDLIGALRNAALPGWPNGGAVEVCPESARFIWNDAALTGQCTGAWTWVDEEDMLTFSEFPSSIIEVDTWAQYTTIPAYAQPAPASRWYFDNVTLDGSPTE